MLSQFSVSNFMSFNNEQIFSMKAGKIQKHADRIYRDGHLSLTKCQVIFGANASGKSNSVEAIRFMQYAIVEGLPRGFSGRYFRQIPENKWMPSSFEVELVLDQQRFVYGFSLLLRNGFIQKEYLYEITKSNLKKSIFERNLETEEFRVGEYFKNKDDIDKIRTYGVDSSSDAEMLFLTVMNHGKAKMYEENPNLKVLRKIFRWFRDDLTVSDPDSPLTGYPYFSEANLPKLADLLHALGTGTSSIKMVEVPVEMIKDKIPKELFKKIVTELEKNLSKSEDESAAIMLRSRKEFYVFEMSNDEQLVIRTIELSHENADVFFHLEEESDGIARLLDLIEILLEASDRRVFVIDEFDRCLHPLLTTRVISLFLDMAKERDAQLIITTHESRLLAEDFLRNDEIRFVTKNLKGESIFNPVEKYHLRPDKKVYAALFDGTLEDVLPAYDEKETKEALKGW